MKRSIVIVIGVIAAAALVAVAILHRVPGRHGQPKSKAPAGFVTQRDGKLWLDGQPYRFAGVNLWCGAILGSTGVGGDRERLLRELDNLHELGLDNLRILVGADGNGTEPHQVTPCLQTAPGVYNDTLLDGLDYLLSEMQKRGMKAVLYMNNAWGWSGGFSFYLRHAAGLDAPDMIAEGYRPYIGVAAEFARNAEAQRLYMNHLRHIIGRTNRYTRTAYKDDPTIMAWQLCNEPRAFGDSLYGDMLHWLHEAAVACKQTDPNHLVSTGSEGIWGCDGHEDVHRMLCEDPFIDYLTLHVWPVNWSWSTPTTLTEQLPQVCENTAKYIGEHLLLAQELKKPIVIEEFGYPRDGYSFDREATLTARDAFVGAVVEVASHHPIIAGMNIWAWGGECKPQHEFWQPGDPLAGDPPQEQQGLYSVFATDSSTIRILRMAMNHNNTSTD